MINTKYSYKDFTHKTFTEIDPDEFSNSEIVGSCFYQESAYDADAAYPGASNNRETKVDVFPNGINNVTFRNCNLDNVKIPGPPNEVINCSTMRLRIMNDLSDWELGSDFKPTIPLDASLRTIAGVSSDPSDIPTTKLSTHILENL
jgi:hypothetical protein